MNPIQGGYDTVGIRHTPGQVGGHTVVTIAGELTTDPTDGVADGQANAAGIRCRRQRRTVSPDRPHNRERRHDEAAVPGQAAAGKQTAQGLAPGDAVRQLEEHEIQLGTCQPTQDTRRDQGRGQLRVDATAIELALDEVVRRQKTEHDHRAEGGETEGADFEPVWIHVQCPVAEITCGIRAYETAGLRRPGRKARDQGVFEDTPRGAQRREPGCIGVRKRKGSLRQDITSLYPPSGRLR